MKETSLIGDVLASKEKQILSYIRCVMGRRLRKHLAPEEVLGDAVRYLLERPQWIQERSAEQLFVFLLWKCKMIVIDRARRLKGFQEYWLEELRPLSELVHEGGSVEKSPSLILHRQQKRDDFRNLLNLIKSQNQRMALELVRMEGLSLAQAGAVMGKHPEAVRDLVRSAVTNLVRHLRASGGFKYATTGETS